MNKYFKKSHIKNGAVVILRNYQSYLKVDDTLLCLDMSGYYKVLSDYDKKLCHKKYDLADIMKILNPRKNYFHETACNCALENLESCIKGYSDWTWERKEENE